MEGQPFSAKEVVTFAGGGEIPPPPDDDKYLRFLPFPCTMKFIIRLKGFSPKEYHRVGDFLWSEEYSGFVYQGRAFPLADHNALAPKVIAASRTPNFCGNLPFVEILQDAPAQSIQSPAPARLAPDEQPPPQSKRPYRRHRQSLSGT